MINRDWALPASQGEQGRRAGQGRAGQGRAGQGRAGKSMSVIGSGNVQISGLDVASFFYHTRKGLGRFMGAVYWLFRWKVTVLESALVNHIWPKRDAIFIKSYLKSRLKSRKIALTGSGRFNNYHPKQQYENSCGAQCLRQTAYELGIKNIPKKKLFKFDGQSIKDNSAEAAIYGITGGLLNTHDGTLKPDLKGDLNKGGYSWPVGIKKAAQILGLDSRFYCSSWFTDWYFKRSHPSSWKEIKRCYSVHRCSPPNLCSNERLLVHVCNYSITGLAGSSLSVKRDHYIMQRPDGSCYDPYKGANYRSVEAYSAATGMRPSGIYMLVSDSGSYAKSSPV